MKTTLRKTSFENIYNQLVNKYNLIYTANNWDEIKVKTEIADIISNSELANIYNTQSLIKLVDYCYDRYYRVMRYLLLQK